ncbi:MAG TPA: tetratricopeptide repeat protein [Gemmatimonadaceae bacterium]|nr:tetratricopeptide repeat protein [Gemmatimonadaceae bacterium]
MASSARIEELTKKFEENPRRYFAPLANEYRKAGDLAQAISICRAHLPQQPGHMSGHVVFGQALFESGALDESKQVFETALQLDPENLIALRYLGDIALRRGDRAEARSWYQRVLEVDPRNEETLGLLAEVDGMRTPLSTSAIIEAAGYPEAHAAPAADMGAVPIGVVPTLDEVAIAESTDATDSALPGELPPAVFDAETELAEEAGLLDGFSAPGDELGAEREAEGGYAASAPLAGLEPTEFESTSLVDMVGASSPPISDEQARLLEPTDAVEPRGFEPTSAEPHELERSDDAIGSQPSGFTSSLSFDDEPADSSPMQDGPPESESAPLLAHDLALPRLDVEPEEVEPAATEAALPDLPEPVGIESPTSIDSVPSEAASAAAAEDAERGDEAAVPAASAGFVTETMAELYLRQGHRDAALEVFRRLAAQQPGDERLRARLEELERSGEPSIRSFLAGIASRRPRTAAYDGREAESVPAGEWVAAPSAAVGDLTAAGVPTEVMGWQESNDVVSEIPLADAASEGVLAGELTPAVLDGMEELTEAPPPAPEPEPTRRSAPFMVDESAVPFDLPRTSTPTSSLAPGAPTATPSTVPAVAAVAPERGSLDALFGNRDASAADDAAASALAQAFAPVQESTPLAGRPAVQARDELSLDRVFRADEEAESARSGGFSFDQFFGSRTPHAGNASVPTPGGSSAGRSPTPGARTPGESTPSTPSPAEPDDIEQFNSWLQGLKKR